MVHGYYVADVIIWSKDNLEEETNIFQEYTE
jgi:hypothetical protein